MRSHLVGMVHLLVTNPDRARGNLPGGTCGTRARRRGLPTARVGHEPLQEAFAGDAAGAVGANYPLTSWSWLEPMPRAANCSKATGAYEASYTRGSSRGLLMLEDILQHCHEPMADERCQALNRGNLILKGVIPSHKGSVFSKTIGCEVTYHLPRFKAIVEDVRWGRVGLTPLQGDLPVANGGSQPLPKIRIQEASKTPVTT